jgi:hypothetical protein
VLSDVVAIYVVHVHGVVMGFEGWMVVFMGLNDGSLVLLVRKKSIELFRVWISSSMVGIKKTKFNVSLN